MTTLTFSILEATEKSVAHLRQLLAEFESLSAVRVELRQLSWDLALSEHKRFATTADAPDVSQVGSTWLPMLSALNGLRPYTVSDLAPMGGPGTFHDGLWRSGVEDGVAWAVPWLIDTRLIWYWRDMLAAAGVAERDAFASHPSLVETLRRVHAVTHSGWVMPTQSAWATLNNAASWIWFRGGEFLSLDGRRMLIDQPEALAGLKDFMGLLRFVALELRGLDIYGADRAFGERRAAAHIAGPWIPDTIAAHRPHQSVAELACAPMPGWSAIGGSSLVIWRHSRQEAAALDLVRFLTSRASQFRFARLGNLLPSRLDVLTDPGLNAEPRFRMLSTNAQRGRPFPAHRRWQDIETQLTASLDGVWCDVLAKPAAELETALDAILARHVSNAARRLDAVLAA